MRSNDKILFENFPPKECLKMRKKYANHKYIIFITFLFFLFSFTISLGTQEDIQGEEEIILKPTKARVMDTAELDNIDDSLYNMYLRGQVVTLEILEGAHKGETVIAEYYYEEFEDMSSPILKPRDKVLAYIDEDEQGNIVNADVSDFLRQDFLLYLAIGFVLLLLILGGMKGLKSVIALAITCFAVVRIMIPAILSGANPVIASVLVCVGVIVITLLIVGGLNSKSLSAIIGCSGGVIVAGIIALLAGSLMRFTGLGDEEAKMLMYIPQNINFNFRGLLFAGIIVGALGAAMDVGISIASAMNEIVEQTENISMGALVKAGLNIGRDIMGTMSNTLILAYTGGSLQLLMLIIAYDISFVEIINRETMAIEILRALAGSIGLIFTIPITSVSAGFLLIRKHKMHVKE